MAKHGGKRAGAGKPPKAARQLQKATKLLLEMSKQVEQGLGRIAVAFPDLVQDEIETAQDPDAPIRVRQKARHFLIDRALTSIVVGEEEPGGSTLERWVKEVLTEETSVKVERTYVAEPDPQPVLTIEHQPQRGAE